MLYMPGSVPSGYGLLQYYVGLISPFEIRKIMTQIRILLNRIRVYSTFISHIFLPAAFEFVSRRSSVIAVSCPAYQNELQPLVGGGSSFDCRNVSYLSR